MTLTNSPIFKVFFVHVALCLAAHAQASEPATRPTSQAVATAKAVGGTVRGTVKSGIIPLPGVTISAANTLTGKKIFTSSDTSGNFEITVTGKGRWVVRAEMVAFAPGTKEIVFNAENAASTQRADFELILLSRQQQQQQPDEQSLQQIANAIAGRGFQNLSLSQSEGGDTASALASADTTATSMPTSALGADAASESVSVTGAMGRTENFSFEDRKSTRLNSSHIQKSRMPSSA